MSGTGGSLRRAARAVVRFGATPVFALMAAVNAAVPLHHAGASQPGALTSMWLMYALMAVFHASPMLAPGDDRQDDAPARNC